MLLVFATLAATSIAYKTDTADEPKHIVRGYAFLITGDARLSSDDPPLVNAISALPLLLIDDSWGVALTDENESWRTADMPGVRARLRPYISDLQSLTLARLPIIGLGLLLGALLYRWVAEATNATTATAALFLYTLCPNILAHAGLSTTDLGMALGTLLTVYTVWRYARKPTWPRLLLVALGFGLAVMVKHSALLLPGILPLVAALIAWLDTSRENRLQRTLKVVPLVAFAVVIGWLIALVLFYGTGTAVVRDLEPSYDRWVETITATRKLLGGSGPLADWGDETLNTRPLPAPRYIYGILINVILNNARGNRTYLHGQVGMYGWPEYFPIAIGIKTPLPILILLASTLVCLTRKFVNPGGQLDARRPLKNELSGNASPLPSSALATWTVVPLAFLGAAMSSQIHLGLRHVLMIYPFLFAIAGWGATTFLQLRKTWGTAILAALAAWYLAANAFIYPHYLEYFNELIGGPSNGYKWLVDSNLDWGQDRGYVKQYKEAHGIPSWKSNPGCEPQTGWVVVSARHLVGMMDQNPDCYAWTKGYLVDRINYTWFVFYIPDKPDSLAPASSGDSDAMTQEGEP
jgi:4-amino-4-deoxy-L-arabinose transferase-like glycosyltransferase